MSDRILHLVVCGAPLAVRIADGVKEARQRGWTVAIIPTEAAHAWIDLAALDGTPVVGQHRQPSEEKRLPPADAIAVAPLTFNSLNAWATGIANTYPLATLCAALGRRVPIVAVPFAKDDLAGHPAWLGSLAVLQYAGVRLVDPSTGRAGSAEPIASGTGARVAEEFEWSWILDQLEELTRKDVEAQEI
ncbi:flavoprotein [Microlunatus parietis]|uniref:Phosphopantothenoylcysteine synthetase/decarboxylase n=1 Tax=Microlunatus parietis TaxID=682979 RepID=A0A7Y9I806_9ACTN|nr:flavoprotein [Microlunatus parietis]NYE71902.1 phosphopantothenoylcysteine synthetase/decarboxylase [Microlunatus parietis]